jgi:hypothetical protein
MFAEPYVPPSYIIVQLFTGENGWEDFLPLNNEFTVDVQHGSNPFIVHDEISL